jgi:hypothetical protein
MPDLRTQLQRILRSKFSIAVIEIRLRRIEISTKIRGIHIKIMIPISDQKVAYDPSQK